MKHRLALFVAFLLASCATPRPAVTPVPEREPAVLPAPIVPPVAAAPLPLRPILDSIRADSAALAAHARDSALDAAMLDRIARTEPPESVTTVAGSDVESEDLRALFDIDVANFGDHDRVRYWVNFFSGPARERMGIWLQRMPRYEPVIRANLVAKGLPGDLAYLPLIESGYSATAVSRSKAMGMWQFMKGTGKFYGLKVDHWVDERRDVPKATEAAVRYLRDLTARFGSPYLAAAAYNGGPGRIQRGLARMDPGDEDDVEDPGDGSPQAGDAAFFLLADTRYIRKETKDYVPKLIAAAIIAKRPERYGFPIVSPPNEPALDSVIVAEATGLDVIARLAGISLADLWEMNPAFLRPLTPPARHSVVRLPGGLGAPTQTALEALPAAAHLTSFPHRTRKGETVTRIANRYGLSVTVVRSLNPALRTRSPRPGEAVQIPGQARIKSWMAEDRRAESSARARARARSHHVRPSRGHPAPRATSRAAAKSTARVHIVKAGETLSSLARRYGISIQALRSANGLSNGRRLLAGRRLTIPS
jgi:membrane-bound lytic murein transglycosylase D